jgi:hypothetical protein
MTGIPKHLQVGQAVNLEEVEAGYQITVLTAGQSATQIVEIGVDYLVIDDAAAGITTRLPVHLLVTPREPAPAPQPEPQAA